MKNGNSVGKEEKIQKKEYRHINPCPACNKQKEPHQKSLTSVGKTTQNQPTLNKSLKRKKQEKKGNFTFR